MVAGASFSGTAQFFHFLIPPFNVRRESLNAAADLPDLAVFDFATE
jgi:hypothetical protein